MLLKLLRGKIHQATVTETNVDYHGSVTIDADLLDATGLLPNEHVTIADCDNGNRFETYVILGERGSGVIGINGAAAKLTQCGNRVIIMAYGLLTPAEAEGHVSVVALVDEDNALTERIEHDCRVPEPALT